MENRSWMRVMCMMGAVALVGVLGAAELSVAEVDRLCPPRKETAAVYKPGAYPPAARSYREAAKMVYRYMTSLPAMKVLVETGRPNQKYQHNAYVSKTHAAHIHAMLDWMELEPERRETALRFAKASAEFLLKELEPKDAPLAYWPPTYGRTPLEFDPKTDGPYKKPAMIGNEPEGAVKYRGEVMLVYPANVGTAFVRYYQATQDARFLEAARGIAATYVRMRRTDGSWPLKMKLATGEPVGENTLVPTAPLTFFERLFDATRDPQWRAAADACFAWLEAHPLQDWNWDGQFEDIKPEKPYRNPTKHNAIDTMLYILKRFPNDLARRATCRRILDFCEKRFVVWEAPENGEKWPAPSVLEQYSCFTPIDASAAKMIRAYVAMYKAEGRTEDLEKARALANTVTRVQQPSGRIPTFWHGLNRNNAGLSIERYDWLNCMSAAAHALVCVDGAVAPRVPGPKAAALGAEFQKTHDEATKRAWYQALEDEKWNFKTRTRSAVDARGVYKFNRASKMACLVLKKTDKAGDSWDEDLGEDGTLHVEWTRKPNGGIDYKYTAPTNWDVFVSAYPGEVTRYGVKVMKSRFGSDPMPEIKLPEGWRIVPGDAYSGVNVREAFLTFEKDGLRLPPPAVELVWPGVGVRTVYGASNVVTTTSGATFVPSARKPPTAFGTSLPREGAISVSLPHHIKGMQAGPHRDVPYPENEIKAMYNFIFALREGFRFLGFDKRDPKDGSLVLCGFESNFPNGHTDFPAHFHIIHSGVDGTQVHHFYMDAETGRVTWDCYQDMSNVMDVWDVVWKYHPGDTFAMYDVHANVSYRVKMLAEGKGFEIALPDNARAFRVCGDRPCDVLDVWTRLGTANWQKIKTVSVHDDPVTGILHTPDGDVSYNPDTGARH